MKKILFLITIIAVTASCSKEPESVNGVLNFSCYTQKKLSTGEYVEQPFKVAVLQIWDANNRDLEIKSSTDAVSGYAYDKISGKSVQSIYTGADLYNYKNEMKQGEYFIFVLTDQNSIPYFAWSYKYFSVYKGETIELKKVFSPTATSLMYDPWVE